MTTKQKVLKRLAELGGRIDGPNYHPIDGWTATIDAPDGWKWDASGTHANCACECGFERVADLWRAAWNEVSHGVFKCDDPDCEHCNEI